MTTTVAPSPLTASDRCDRCGAQAYLRVHLASGSELGLAEAGAGPSAKDVGRRMIPKIAYQPVQAAVAKPDAVDVDHRIA